MTTYDRPHLTHQEQFIELLTWAEEYNAEIIRVNALQWHVLKQCTPSSALRKDANGDTIVYEGRKFQRKAPAKPPHGILDVSGPEPMWEP